MTNRIRTLTVVLDADYRDDDVQPIVNAILMTKGVALVTSTVVNLPDYIARAALKNQLEVQIYEAITKIFHVEDSNGASVDP